VVPTRSRGIHSRCVKRGRTPGPSVINRVIGSLRLLAACGCLLAGALVLAPISRWEFSTSTGQSVGNQASPVGVSIQLASSSLASKPTGTRVVTYYPFTADGRLKPGLRVAEVFAAWCVGQSEAGGLSYRCFTTGHIHNWVEDPCFARLGSHSGPLICPLDPAGSQVLELRVRSLPTIAPWSARRRIWAMRLQDEQVCVAVNAAWSGLGPFQCFYPSEPVADCHSPVMTRATWTAACQAKLIASSPFTRYRVQTVWD